MIFEPRIIFSLLWLGQIFGYLLIGDDFTAFDFLTWSVVGIAIIGFWSGSTFASYLPMPQVRRTPSAEYDCREVRMFMNVAICAYLLACVVGTVNLVNVLSVETDGVFSAPAIRQAVIFDFLGERQILKTMRLFYFGVGLCLYVLAFATYLSRRMLCAVLLIGLFSAVVTTGRLYLLLFFISAAALLYRQKIVSLKTVVGGALAFVALFFLVAVVFEKSAGGNQSLFEQVVWNGKVYLLSSLACFNNYVHTGDQQVLDGTLLPNIFRELINQVFGTEIAFKPDLNPFAEVPLQCNTYTVLFPLFHDGGLLGTGFGMFIVGAFQRYLFRWQLLSDSPLMSYFFALSLYPLTMTIFEDAYFSSMGFWMLLWLPPIIHGIFRKLLVNRRNGGCGFRSC